MTLYRYFVRECPKAKGWWEVVDRKTKKPVTSPSTRAEALTMLTKYPKQPFNYSI